MILRSWHEATSTRCRVYSPANCRCLATSRLATRSAAAALALACLHCVRLACFNVRRRGRSLVLILLGGATGPPARARARGARAAGRLCALEMNWRPRCTHTAVCQQPAWHVATRSRSCIHRSHHTEPSIMHMLATCIYMCVYTHIWMWHSLLNKHCMIAALLLYCCCTCCTVAVLLC